MHENKGFARRPQGFLGWEGGGEMGEGRGVGVVGGGEVGVQVRGSWRGTGPDGGGGRGRETEVSSTAVKRSEWASSDQV